MTQFRHIIMWVMMAWLLVACATPTTPSKEYLLMDWSLNDAQTYSTEAVSIQFMPVIVANYLAGNEIVLVSKQGDVHRSQGNLWAEALSPQLSRLTQQHLEKVLPNVTWFGGQRLPSYTIAMLNIEVDDFYADLDGVVHISGRWQMISNMGELATSNTFNVQSKLTSDGYSTLVQTLSASWFQQVVTPMVEDIALYLNSQ